MATNEEVRWHPPLKAPVIEIVDLLTDDESVEKGAKVNGHVKDSDASVVASGSESDEDSQFSLWEETLNTEEEEGTLHYGKTSGTLYLMSAIAKSRRRWRMYARRSPSLSQTPKARWRGTVFCGDSGDRSYLSEEAMHCFWHSTTILLGRRARRGVLPSLGLGNMS